ncbi:MAG TPA: hypothetical protein VJR04_10970 [Terriglobales bacterium]|nr:hypothetical protein [Terriglobales bacterium]
MLTRRPSKRKAQEKKRSPGAQLRSIREQLDLTLRDVEYQSAGIARKLGSKAFRIPFSRLHEIESKQFVPNIFRVYSLSRIYGMRSDRILELYGIPRR